MNLELVMQGKRKQRKNGDKGSKKVQFIANHTRMQICRTRNRQERRKH